MRKEETKSKTVNIMFNAQVHILWCQKKHHSISIKSLRKAMTAKPTHDPQESHTGVCILMPQNAHLLRPKESMHWEWSLCDEREVMVY